MLKNIFLTDIYKKLSGILKEISDKYDIEYEELENLYLKEFKKI